MLKLLYESVAEGGITRFVAVFSSPIKHHVLNQFAAFAIISSTLQVIGMPLLFTMVVPIPKMSAPMHSGMLNVTRWRISIVSKEGISVPVIKSGLPHITR